MLNRIRHSHLYYKLNDEHSKDICTHPHSMLVYKNPTMRWNLTIELKTEATKRHKHERLLIFNQKSILYGVHCCHSVLYMSLLLLHTVKWWGIRCFALYSLRRIDSNDDILHYPHYPSTLKYWVHFKIAGTKNIPWFLFHSISIDIKSTTTLKLKVLLCLAYTHTQIIYLLKQEKKSCVFNNDKGNPAPLLKALRWKGMR